VNATVEQRCTQVITRADVAEAQRAAQVAEEAAAALWEHVEQATAQALAAEGHANRLRSTAQRLSLQIGFRRVGAA
jgi:hypothetical protein